MLSFQIKPSLLLFVFPFSAPLVRLNDNRDFYDPFPQIATILFFSLGENKNKAEKKISAFVCYLENFVPITKISIIYQQKYLPCSSFLPAEKKKRMRNYYQVCKYIRAPVDFVGKLLHKSAELSCISLLKGCSPCLKGK